MPENLNVEQGATLRDLNRVARLQAAALHAARGHYDNLGLVDIPVPVLVGITGACENVGTLFRLSSSERVHLTQTGQLALEQALQSCGGVYCFTKSFRTDHVDERHLAEFMLLEEEVCCNHPSVGMAVEGYQEDRMFEVLLEHASGAVKAIIQGVLSREGDLLRVMGVDVGYLETVVRRPFTRITYTDAIDMLRNDGSIKGVEWGVDLGSRHERRVLELLNVDGPALPAFITHYPKEIKFFNMKVSETDPRVVNSADLLLPGVGEAVGSAVREHDYGRLVDRLLNSTMFAHIQEQGLATIDDFRPYLDVIENGRTAPHAGYGIGLERLIQFILGETDIRRSSATFLVSELMGFNRHLERAQTGSRAPGF